MTVNDINNKNNNNNTHDTHGNTTHPSRVYAHSTLTMHFPIPRGLPLYDAHCHPTDAPSSLAHVGGMRTARLVAMATRAQDQALVADAAAAAPDRVVPAFGWHPWFSHQLYDDVSEGGGKKGGGGNDGGPRPPPESSFDDDGDGDDAFKTAHYKAVLTPEPSQDFIRHLPAPRRLSEFLSETRARLREHPGALVGEIGVDKVFRLPEAFDGAAAAAAAAEGPSDDGAHADVTPGGREGRRLSPHRVRVPHQVAVMAAQLRLAAEMERAVSVHSVKAHGIVFDALEELWRRHKLGGRRKRRLDAQDSATGQDFDDVFDTDPWGGGSCSGDAGDDIDDNDRDDNDRHGAATASAPSPKPFPPRICLHSFSGTVEVVAQYLNPSIPAAIYFSFSHVVNMAGPSASDDKFMDVLKAVPAERILLESDWHRAGAEMEGKLEEVYSHVCWARGWAPEECARRVEQNFCAFLGEGEERRGEGEERKGEA
jgi:Tat protein secretion system quality control protein TatD with DNase activity